MTLKNFWPFFLWLIVILYLSFTPLTNWPQPTFFQKIYIDKLVHIFMYSVLSFLLLRSIFKQQKNQTPRYPFVIASLVFCAGLGVSIEFLQPVLTSYRKFEWLDMVANATGALVGLYIFKYFLPRRWMGLKTIDPLVKNQ